MKQVTTPDPDRDLTREERRIYERQEHARKVYLLKQIAYVQGRIPEPPEYVPCPIDPRK
jgi:hypothetical protein